MKLELESGALHLAHHQTVRVTGGAGSTICAVEGAVWITEENQPMDVVLRSGECYRLRRPGVALLNPLGAEAAVRFV